MTVDTSSSQEKYNLLGYSLEQLEELIAGWGHKKFRAKQLYRWIHQKGAHDFSEMTDLAKEFRQELLQKCTLPLPNILADKTAKDGTRKWLLDVGGNNAIEMVFIPEDDRGTLCVSTQAGCNVGCPFCSTGYQGFSRNLTAAEIVMQLWWANKVLAEDGTGLEKRHFTENARIITNVVFMGMGEPLLNYSATLHAIRVFLDDNAYGLSRRRVTVSTSGVLPAIERLANDCPVALAVSLHAPFDALRNDLVPLNKKYPIQELLSVCRAYLAVAPRDFITFEYIMLEGINDTLDCAEALIKIAQQIPSKVNLIPFNPYPQSGLKRSSDVQVKMFAQKLLQANIVTTVRKTRGDDIDAACGQLAGEVQDRTQLKMREKSVVFFSQNREV